MLLWQHANSLRQENNKHGNTRRILENNIKRTRSHGKADVLSNGAAPQKLPERPKLHAGCHSMQKRSKHTAGFGIPDKTRHRAPRLINQQGIPCNVRATKNVWGRTREKKRQHQEQRKQDHHRNHANNYTRACCMRGRCNRQRTRGDPF